MRRLLALLPYFRPYKGKLLLGVLFILVSVAVGLAGPVVIGRAVDAFRAEVTGRTLLGYGGLLLLLTAIQGLFSFGQRMTLVALSRDIEYDLRNDYFRHLERLPQSFFQDSYTGDLMARGTNDLQAVRMVCGPAIMYSCNTVFTATGALILMARIHPVLTLLALCTMPLVAVVTQVFGARIHRLFESVQEQFAALSAKVQENLSGVRVVRAYSQEEAEEESFERLNEDYVERNRRLIRWTAAFHPLLQGLVGVGFVAVLWYGTGLVNRATISLGEFVSFNFFLAKLIWPMIAIGWVINLVQRGAASFGRIQRVLLEVPAIRNAADAVDPGALDGAVAFRDLTFSYDGNGAAPALVDIDLDASAGQTVALVGRTGAGKSTLLALIPRLVDPPPGALVIDDVDVTRLTLERLRDSVALVPQETFLFSTTVRENIALGAPDAAPREIEAAAEIAGLGPDLELFPDGLETMVGERGITLSGGQKQRVALARALVRDPRILLLDDCFSAVDTHTEEQILGNLRVSLAGRTVFLVSHRISTVQHADQIVVLDHGRIVERGTHEELLAHGGLYADLEQRQRLEEELATV